MYILKMYGWSGTCLPAVSSLHCGRDDETMKLVIVESPTKTKSLSKYLGGDFEILASMGHVRDLPKSKFGIEIKDLGKDEFEFTPTYAIMDKKEDTVKRLKVEAARADEVILASDPDREGEAIAWHVNEILKDSLKGRKKQPIFKRVSYNSITKEAILDAMEHPREIDMNMVNSQQARRFLDRLVGYKLSPILWKKVRRGLSAGRVQSVAVRLIVEREREIEKFVPVEYWQIRALVRTQGIKTMPAGRQDSRTQEEFWVELARFKKNKAEIHNGEEAKTILAVLETAEYVVSDIKKAERKTQPHAPFKTSTLQQAAANVLGWSAKRTMNIAQKLYEQGDITYHRTDSFNLAPVAIEEVRRFIVEKYGAEYLPKTSRVYKTTGKVVAQEAHEAVRPTHIEVTPEKYIGQEMAMDEKKLYSLIWRRTVACQMAEAVFDDTKVVVTAEACELTANGIVVKFDGWKKLFVKDSEELQALPELSVREVLSKKKVESLQKFTQPPARFNDASLIKELEKKGIGRPSTYAAIISTIIDRRYVEQKDKKFFPTSIGKAVVDFLMENFPREMQYEFTAKMEDSLDDIANGKLPWMEMLSKFWGDFSRKLFKVDKESARVGVPTTGTGVRCPLCGVGEVVIRDGKFGKFLSCNRYPECTYKAPYIVYVEDVVCEKCGKRVVLKKTRTGRDFYGCEDYPNCTWASWKKPQTVANTESDTGSEVSGEDGNEVEIEE
ncbi:TPA: type I DNA topoisomerase [Candidatus Collierbacteria bacterium]|uniref:DNA topoisomerase 1 n=1 Tax=Candidatus Collierbacteria bacterium GW2011_GWB2_44_22 TaxID=1618387 RepID=A0A0G1KUX2_9BACT|nr:MAG: topoisomerase I protein [Candidatus Collierbacteria bacterium GW2011_GWB2_44_22]KKT66908.1 MAG: topoisomerase I protein [Candidatus Collierbacteria bacterium GW2011_GWC2_44_30]HCQ31569.1 type I DNA topoisomerase [Candidatus Collierbacteria bacterium]